MSAETDRQREVLRGPMVRAVQMHREGRLTDDQLMAVTRGTAEVIDLLGLPPSPGRAGADDASHN